ncbi:LysR family transcriptional regulator [Labrenzia sp. PHM005]|uniref:LysR family transcriptional regulator n=1 Tax=Labrenzia sp. PHM005 TaxID=2590016 RepID=UPI001140918F|nr:LysR family transcriptional regulator [Labrenzia sp. PHM005]QDG77951.1 LysR family transcriptional regulator [Labrenzia sp. PHM005]
MAQPKFDKLPLEWVRAFEAAARCGSFTGAAEETGLTQSAISQRIGKLEKLLGTQLFLRQPRSIALTVEGEAWLPHVRSAFDRLRDSSEGLFGVSRNRLTVSASTSIIDLWIMSRLNKLSEATGAQFSFKTMVLTEDGLQDDDIIRVRYGTGTWPVAYKVPLYKEILAPVAAPKLLKSKKDWQDLPRIAVSGPRPGWNDWILQFGAPAVPLPEYRFDTFSSALTAAKAGLGVLLGSLPLCQAALATGDLIRLSEESLPHHQTYWLLASKEAVSNQQWQTLEDELTEAHA